MDNESILNLLLTMYSELGKRDFEFTPELKKDFDSAIQFLHDDRNSANLLYREIMEQQGIFQSILINELFPAVQKVDNLRSDLLKLLLWGKEKELSNLDDQV